MEHMPEFRLLQPETVAEAVAARRLDPHARFLAGGTDLIPNVRRGIAAPPVLIDLTGVAEMRGIAIDPEGLRIGAAVTLAELIDHAAVRAEFPVLGEAAAQVAAASHREVATVGGNLCLDTRCVFYNQSEWWRSSNAYCFKHRGDICHVAPKTVACFAVFSGDLAPALIVLAAEALIAAPGSMRTVPLAAMYRDDGRDHLRLAADELLVAVRVPPAGGWQAGYMKARVRSAIDFPLAGVAAALSAAGGVVTGLRLALTATNAMPLLVQGTDRFLGSVLDEAALAGIADLLPKQIQPMSSTFTPPGYRRRVVANLTRALLRRLSAQATALS